MFLLEELEEDELLTEVAGLLYPVLLEEVAEVLPVVAVLRDAEDCLEAAGLVLLETETTPVPVDAVEDDV